MDRTTRKTQAQGVGGTRFGARRGALFGAGGGAALLAAACVAGAPAHAAGIYASDWAVGAKSEARLVAADRRLAGFEIRLAPGAITYWRNPGDAGLPPTLDFSASDNVAAVETVFPAPKRIHESDGSEAFGYDATVLLPLKVRPEDPGKPVKLSLKADYAVCEKICLPARATLSLSLPAAGGSPYAGPLAAALAAAPRPAAPDALGTIAAEGGDGWRFCAAMSAAAPADLFVEAPDGWWIASGPEAGAVGCFRLSLQQAPKDAKPPVKLRLTLTGGPQALEATLTAPALN